MYTVHTSPTPVSMTRKGRQFSRRGPHSTSFVSMFTWSHPSLTLLRGTSWLSETAGSFTPVMREIPRDSDGRDGSQVDYMPRMLSGVLRIVGSASVRTVHGCAINPIGPFS